MHALRGNKESINIWNPVSRALNKELQPGSPLNREPSEPRLNSSFGSEAGSGLGPPLWEDDPNASLLHYSLVTQLQLITRCPHKNAVVLPLHELAIILLEEKSTSHKSQPWADPVHGEGG